MRPLVALSLLWFFCLGGLGVFFPFYSLYLSRNGGLTGTQVGAVMAMLPLTGILAQPFWGQVADRTGSRTRVLALVIVCASGGYVALALASGFTGFLLQTAALAFFSTAMIPSCVAVTLALSREIGPNAFGLARVWGSIGFLLLVLAFPRVLDAMQAARGLVPSDELPEPGLELMFPLTGAIVLVGALFALRLPRSGAVSLRATRGDWRRLLRHRPYLRLLAYVLLAYLCLHGPMTLFPIWVDRRGGSMDSVSQMWVLMLLVEIPLVALSGANLRRFGPRGLMAIAVLAGGFRWTVCGFTTDWRLIYAVQMMHGVVVAGLVIGAPLYVEATVPERLRSTAQGALAMIGISLGGISSNLGSGWLLDHVSADAPYRVGGLGALALALLLPLVIPPAVRPGEPASSDRAGALPVT